MIFRYCQRCQRVSTLSALSPPKFRSHAASAEGPTALTTADSADGKHASKPSPAVGVSAVSLARADTPRLFTPSSLYFPPCSFRRNPLTPLTPSPLAASPQARCPSRLLRPSTSAACARNTRRPQ